MIKIEHETKNREIYIKAQGHADYAPKGQDVVCAGASALLGAIGLYASQQEHRGSVGAGSMYIVMRDNKANRAVVQAVSMGLRELSDQYPAHIQFTSKNNPETGKK